jgi:hypothetical protein
MIDTKEMTLAVKQFAQKQSQPIPSDAQIETVIATIDENAVIESWRNRIEAKMWDGVSDINSASAFYIRESNPWLDVVYVLLIDNQVFYMQTHNPFELGFVPITLDNVDAISAAHANLIAKQNADSDIFNSIIEQLNLNDSKS